MLVSENPDEIRCFHTPTCGLAIDDLMKTARRCVIPGGRRGISSYQDITSAYNTKHPKSSGSDPPNLGYALQVCYFVNLLTINALSATYSVLTVLKY